MIRKTVAVIAAIVILAAIALPAKALEISAESAIVIDADSGKVLYAKEPDRKMRIASTTKIMTALIVLENCSLSDEIEIDTSFKGIEGSSIYLRPGETVTVETLLYGMMLESGNDAAHILAVHTAGGIENFSELMNRKASALGCLNTHFANPHGLDDDDHYSTASDMAKIAAEAMRNKTFSAIVSTRSVSVGGRNFTNHNKLLWSYKGTLGIKTGYTHNSGRSLVSCVQKNGLKLICVTLDAPDDWTDHKTVCDWIFSSWERVNICKAGEKYCDVPVISGEKKEVSAAPAETLSVTVPKDSDIKVNVYLNDMIYAPVIEGSVAGEIRVLLDDKEIASTELIYTKSVEISEQEKITGFERIKRMMFSLIDKGMGILGYSPEEEKLT